MNWAWVEVKKLDWPLHWSTVMKVQFKLFGKAEITLWKLNFYEDVELSSNQVLQCLTGDKTFNWRLGNV